MADMILEQKLKKESDEKAENKAIEERKESEQRSKVMDGICHFYAPVLSFYNIPAIVISSTTIYFTLIQVEQAKEFIKTSRDERYAELHRGIILSETMAQMEADEIVRYLLRQYSFTQMFGVEYIEV